MNFSENVKRLFGKKDVQGWLRMDEPAIPSDEWLKSVEKKHTFTKDSFNLDDRAFHRLFVYCDVQSGHQRHDKLVAPGNERVAVAFTKDPYTLWKKKLGKDTYPIALTVPWVSRINNYFGIHREPRAKVKGELWQVTGGTIKQLDQHKENGVSFRRKRIKVIVPYHRVDGKSTVSSTIVAMYDAWAYIGIKGWWDDLIDDGYHFRTVKSYQGQQPYLKNYYCFTPMEYNEDS